MNRRRIKDLGETDAPPQFAVDALDLSHRGHRIEQAVQRELMAATTVRFASLVVRRVENNGICLQGVVETNEDVPDFCKIVQRVPGVDQVLNHLLVTPRRSVPPKG
jgi:osmotically-inducible protein OsmY